MSGWMSSDFFKSLLLLQFCQILAKLGTRVNQYAQNYGTDFRNFYFKIFGDFFSSLHFDLVSGTSSAEFSRLFSSAL